MHLDFLAADTPLVKTFALVNGEIEKSPYPMVRDFTSHRVEVNNLAELYETLLAAAKLGQCLQKGPLARQVVNESRAGLTNAANATQILILDFDQLEGSIPDVLKILGLDNYAHIIQWSASSHLPAAAPSALPALLSAHVFFWLANPVNPQLLKSWLTNACLKHFPQSITLTRSGAALHWPIDPSVMDNSKLIYIAPPVLRGLKSRIQGLGISLTTKPSLTPAVPSSLFSVNTNAVQKARMDCLNNLRRDAGLSVLRDSQLKIVSGQLCLTKPGVAQLTGLKNERGWVYLNLNGGDSWGYYHPEENAELIYNFKGEPLYRTEELLPEYWADLHRVRRETNDAIDGECFVCWHRAEDLHYGGFYDAETNVVHSLHPGAKQNLKAFLKNNGLPSDTEPVQIETKVYNPQSDELRFDASREYLNTYCPGPLYGEPRKTVTEIPPTIRKVIESAVGTGETFTHFVNWVAGVVQLRCKTGTAWVLHGVQGTGKGVLFNRILKPMLGESNARAITMAQLEEPYNDYLEGTQLVLVDEVQVSSLREARKIDALLRTYITEPVVNIRRMRANAYKTASYCNFILASNQPDPVGLGSKEDRRFHVGQYQATPWRPSSDELSRIDTEVVDFFHYIMGLQVVESDLRRILENEDRDQLVNLSRTAAEIMAQSLIDGDLEDLVINLPKHAVTPEETGYRELILQILRDSKTETRLERDDLLKIFMYRVGGVPVSPNKFTSYLKHQRINTQRLRIGERITYGIEVTWKQEPSWMVEQLQLLSPKPSSVRTKVSPIKKASVSI